MLTLLAGGSIVYFGLMPEKYIEGIKAFYQSPTQFAIFFICALIITSVATIDRNQLLGSFAGLIPAVLGCIAFAFLFGWGAGLVLVSHLKKLLCSTFFQLLVEVALQELYR